MDWSDLDEVVLIGIAVGGLPAIALLGWLMRRAHDRRVKLACWLALAFLTALAWLICLPATRRTNEPSLEGKILIYGLIWGPVAGAAWILLQWVAARRARPPRGFEVANVRETPLVNPPPPK